ncbi:MAG TPA: 5'-3' exonuclease H3TH domain-containing protein [Acidimicrobiales bacterium]|nr:5'-3' exonuclease H3TH domain-containing protein [Acidimicrobiales bacterium]
MNVVLVDGTYELFRYYYGQPSHRADDAREVGATRGVLASIVSILEDGHRFLGVATDHTVESFRNGLYLGYKTGKGVDTELLAQFPLVEEALRALGVVVWPMVEYEADDALASACARAELDERVDLIIVCSPDKDLAQCVRGDRVIQRNRRTEIDENERAIWEHFGVAPSSIPDWLALVGDSSDGFPGLRGWGKKSASRVLSHYGHLEAIPLSIDGWVEDVRTQVRGAERLCHALADGIEDAFLFRDLATLRRDYSAFDDVDELRWRGPRDDFDEICAYLGAKRLRERIARLSLTAQE